MKRGTFIKYGAIFLIFAVMAGLYYFVHKSRNPPSPSLGNRDKIETLPQNNVVYTRLYKDPKSNKVFVRHIIQKPPKEDLSWFTLVKAKDPDQRDRIKSVHLVVKGQKMDGNTTVKQMSNLTLRFSKFSPYFQYYDVNAFDIMNLSNEIGNPIMEFDWISFDVELDFPMSATRKEKEDFVQIYAYGHIVRSDNKDQKTVFYNQDPQYNESFNMIASPK